MLAAEYVLGTLEDQDAQEAAHLLATDPAFVDAVHAWEERLLPLAAATPPVEPPASLWTRIEGTAELSEPAPHAAAVVPLALRRRLRMWQATAGAALALAAALAGFIVLRPPPSQVAVLAPLAGATPVLLATASPAGELTVRPDAAIAVPPGRDLELWALPDGESRPRSLGVLPAAGEKIRARVASGTRLLVSLEPAGGSPTGQPTGPVLYGGRLTEVE